jgi:hypothetical protein
MLIIAGTIEGFYSPVQWCPTLSNIWRESDYLRYSSSIAAAKNRLITPHPNSRSVTVTSTPTIKTTGIEAQFYLRLKSWIINTDGKMALHPAGIKRHGANIC